MKYQQLAFMEIYKSNNTYIEFVLRKRYRVNFVLILILI